jgi:hypothetical protein
LGHLIDLHVCSHLKAFQFKYRHGRDERLSRLAAQRVLPVHFDNAMSIPIIDTITDRRSNKDTSFGDGDVRTRMSSNDIEFSGLGEGPAYIGCVRISAN